MKTRVLSAAACLALTAMPAAAAPIVFNTTGAIVDYTVPATGQYTVTAVGAKGGDGVSVPLGIGSIGKGGLGAEAGGTFLLAQGEVLQILVGAAGTTFSPVGYNGLGGGGGGSFVVGPGDVPLVAAGGGGGGGSIPAAAGGVAAQGTVGLPFIRFEDGGDALTTLNGESAAFAGPNNFPNGGLGGTGGTDGQTGLEAAGTIPFSSNAGRGFDSFPSSLGTGAFGGGGAASYINPLPFGGLYSPAPGGGGGGGYSGGGGGGFILLTKYGAPSGAGGGGGGGSYTAGADPFLLAGVGTGDGFVTITPDAVAVPEPGALALFGMGLFGLCAVRQARRR